MVSETFPPSQVGPGGGLLSIYIYIYLKEMARFNSLSSPLQFLAAPSPPLREAREENLELHLKGFGAAVATRLATSHGCFFEATTL